MNSAKMIKPNILKKPEKVVVLDGSETKVIIKESFRKVKIEQEGSEKDYQLLKTPLKNGLQMIGA